MWESIRYGYGNDKNMGKKSFFDILIRYKPILGSVDNYTDCQYFTRKTT